LVMPVKLSTSTNASLNTSEIIMTRMNKPDERRHISPRKHKNPYKIHHAPAHKDQLPFRAHSNALAANSSIYAYIPQLAKAK
jgi:hypothetical protein